MLLQSLLLVVTLALIGSALLTSTLVSAKSTFHALVLRQSRSAMTDATASFISWTQNNVKKNGIEQLPVWAATPPVLGPNPTCGEKRPVLSNDVLARCKFYRTASWSVTGYTNLGETFLANALTSEANNLATAQSEGRVSATITVTITDNTGSIAYARLSRVITARIFHAPPYAVVSAERDATNEGGAIISAEGDTAGFADQRNRAPSANSIGSSAEPAALTDTRLRTTINCVNTASTGAPAEVLQNGNASFVSVRPYGNLAWSYETPCIPTIPINVATAPQGYQQTFDGSYTNNSTSNRSWRKGDESNSSFAH